MNYYKIIWQAIGCKIKVMIQIQRFSLFWLKKKKKNEIKNIFLSIRSIAN